MANLTQKGWAKKTNPKKMNKKHLFWIVPISMLVALLVGLFVGVSMTVNLYANNYPIIKCIMNGETMLNIGHNNLPFTIESQRQALQWGCAVEYVDFNSTYEDLLEYKIKS